MAEHLLNAPITPGYYALVIGNCHQSLEEAFRGKERLSSAKDALSKSPYGWIVSDDKDNDSLFYVFQVLPGEKVVVMMGDRNLRAETPGDAYSKTSNEMVGKVASFAVVWLGSQQGETRH